MKTRTPLFRLVTPALFAFQMAASAAVSPYTPDANTVHLWHFDEAAGATSAVNSVLGGRSLLAVDGNPASVPLPSASIMGVAGATGFGNAVNISAGDLGLGYDGDGSGDFSPDKTSNVRGADAISTASFMGANGAFTLEAFVSLPSLTSSVNREIIAMDNSMSGTNANLGRPFQFVITLDGKLRFREFANNVTFELALPTTGPDAFQANTWFHAAYTYDGEGTGTLYWTLLDPDRTSASVLATTTGLLDMPVNSAPLVIGNENRDIFNEGLMGSIDEVRISNTARGANEFVFVPEPSSAVLTGVGALLLARRRRSSR